MKFKKLASMVLACVLVLSLAVPVLAKGGSTDSDSGTSATGGTDTSSSGSTDSAAAENTDTSKNLEVTTNIKTPTLKLEVATSNEVIINPYQIAVTMDKKAVTDPIISTPFVLKNLSDCELEMEVAATLEVADTITVLDKVPTKAGTTKDLFIALGAIRTKANKATALEFKSDYKDVTGATGDTVATPTDKETISGAAILKKGEAVKFAKNIILPQTDGQDKNANYVTFQFKGIVNGDVTTPWASTDTISVKVVLNFTPKTPTQKPATTTTE